MGQWVSPHILRNCLLVALIPHLHDARADRGKWYVHLSSHSFPDVYLIHLCPSRPILHLSTLRRCYPLRYSSIQAQAWCTSLDKRPSWWNPLQHPQRVGFAGHGQAQSRSLAASTHQSREGGLAGGGGRVAGILGTDCACWLHSLDWGRHDHIPPPIRLWGALRSSPEWSPDSHCPASSSETNVKHIQPWTKPMKTLQLKPTFMTDSPALVCLLRSKRWSLLHLYTSQQSLSECHSFAHSTVRLTYLCRAVCEYVPCAPGCFPFANFAPDTSCPTSVGWQQETAAGLLPPLTMFSPLFVKTPLCISIFGEWKVRPSGLKSSSGTHVSGV